MARLKKAKGGQSFVSGPSIGPATSATQSGAQSPRIQSNPTSALKPRNVTPVARGEANMSGQTGAIDLSGRTGNKVPKRVGDPVTAQVKAVMKRGR